MEESREQIHTWKIRMTSATGAQAETCYEPEQDKFTPETGFDCGKFQATAEQARALQVYLRKRLRNNFKWIRLFQFMGEPLNEPAPPLPDTLLQAIESTRRARRTRKAANV